MFDLIPDDNRLKQLVRADIEAARRCRISNLEYFTRGIDRSGAASRKWLARAAARRRMIGMSPDQKCKVSGVSVTFAG